MGEPEGHYAKCQSQKDTFCTILLIEGTERVNSFKQRVEW